MGKTFWRVRYGLLAGVVVSVAIGVVNVGQARVDAAQVGPAQQITLNPGGGILTNGSDGIRFTVNSDTATGNPNSAYPGADAVVYRNTYQYCCSAGAPMLNIGGTLYGQAGPAYGSATWNSVEVLSTSGATSLGARTSATGNSSATIRYTVVHGGLTYTVTRAVSYVYPNDYVTDHYTFAIPDGNTATVKFYLGGDTAPGSSDVGYGIMLTSPVRSVISLNTSSQIMFGLREVAGSKLFDGATSQSFFTPYGTVQSGGNIGFVVTGSNHDAGLMMQWNLGSTPGTQTASLQQFATQQGTNLNAVFSTNSTNIDVPATLDVSIVNTVLSTINGLGYTLTLPSGLVIGTGPQSTTCGGTLTATTGTAVVTLSGASVASGSNCVVSLPVVSGAAGTYAISSSSFSALAGALTNNVGASALTVSNPQLGADLNGDGTQDSSQPNVYSYTSSVSGKTVVLEADDACTVSSALSLNQDAVTAGDEGYEYVNGLMDFTLACGTPGFESIIKQYYYDVSSADLVLRKYDPNTETYTTIDPATITQTTINGATVTVVTYSVVDGGALDTDGIANGIITDPAGLASVLGASDTVIQQAASNLPGVPNTGLKMFGIVPTILLGIAGLALLAVSVSYLWMTRPNRAKA